MSKTVVITGSTNGIGKGLAREFLARDCRVIVSGRSDQSVDKALAELEPGAEGRVAGLPCNVCDAAQLEALWSFAVEKFGRVDIWINNAGISIKRLPYQQQEPDSIRAIIETNHTGVALGCRVALAHMLEQGGGQLWNMEGFGSGGEIQPGMAAYGATKRAVTYLTKALAKEVKDTPVQVCALSPGIVVTDLLTGDYDLASPEREKARKIFHILGDTVETVPPSLVEGVLPDWHRGSNRNF